MNPTNQPPAPDETSATPSWGRSHWLVFVAALFGPPLLTALAAMMDRRGPVAPALMFLGGAAGGLVAGVMLGVRFARTSPGKVFLSLFLAGLCALAVVALSGFGCALGGYQINVH